MCGLFFYTCYIQLTAICHLTSAKMKKTLSGFCLLLSSLLFSQQLIDLGDLNPALQSAPLIKNAILDPNTGKLYLWGDLGYVNDVITPELVRLNPDGTLDDSYQWEGGSLDLDAGWPIELIDGALYAIVSGNLIRWTNDGHIDETFMIQGAGTEFVAYKDSILTSFGTNDLRLYNLNGTYRVIPNDLPEEFSNISRLYALSDNRVGVVSSFYDDNDGYQYYKLFLLEDGAFKQNFATVTIKEHNTQLNTVSQLPDGRIMLLISGSSPSVNEVSGNGIYLIDEFGDLDEDSPHLADISTLNAMNSGLAAVHYLDDGKFLVVGQSTGLSSEQYELGRLESNGEVDNSFQFRTIEKYEDYSSPILLENQAGNILIINNQYSYNGVSSGGLNLIDLEGNIIESYTPTLGSLAENLRIEKSIDNKYFLTGSFVKSRDSDNPLIAGFSFNPEDQFPWIPSISLTGFDKIESVKELQNGDLMIGYFDKSRSNTIDNKVLKVYDSQGQEVILAENAYARPFANNPPVVTNIFESDQYIYVTGSFRYNLDEPTDRNVLKFNKNYSLASSFNPDEEVFSNDRDEVSFSYLTNSDRLIISAYNYSERREDMIRLLQDGNIDASFDSLQNILRVSTGIGQVQGDSSIFLSLADDYNTMERVIQLFDIDGKPLNENLFVTGTDAVNAFVNNVIKISDSTFLVGGGFPSINGVEQESLALVNVNKEVYDIPLFDVDGLITDLELRDDTLLVVGPKSINGHKGGAFYAVSLVPEAVNIQEIAVTEEGFTELSWTSDPKNIRFDILRIEEDDTTFLTSLYEDVGSFIDVAAEVNTQYKYLIKSFNYFSANQSETEIEIIKPAAPTNLEVDFEEGSNLLTWTDNADNETAYLVYKKQGDSNYELIAELDANVQAYEDASVEIDNDFEYYVIAKSENFQSDPSSAISIGVFRPLPPENLSYQVRKEDESFFIDLSWDLQDEITESFIIIESLDNADFEPLDTIDVSINTFSTEIEINQTYYYQVISRNEVGVSDEPETIEVDAFRPPAPAGLTFQFSIDEGVILNWEESDDRAEEFVIFESSESPTGFEPIDTTTSLSYGKVLPEDALFYYYVSAQNIFGASSSSDTIMVDTEVLSTGLSKDLLIYPNPNNGAFYVNSNESIDYLEIKSISGKFIKKLRITRGTMSIQNLKPGLYLIDLISNEKVISRHKVVVSE